MPAPWRLVLVIAAILMFVLYAILGGGIIGDKPPDAETLTALLGFGLASFAGAHI